MSILRDRHKSWTRSGSNPRARSQCGTTQFALLLGPRLKKFTLGRVSHFVTFEVCASPVHLPRLRFHDETYRYNITISFVTTGTLGSQVTTSRNSVFSSIAKRQQHILHVQPHLRALPTRDRAQSSRYSVRPHYRGVHTHEKSRPKFSVATVW